MDFIFIRSSLLRKFIESVHKDGDHTEDHGSKKEKTVKRVFQMSEVSLGTKLTRLSIIVFHSWKKGNLNIQYLNHWQYIHKTGAYAGGGVLGVQTPHPPLGSGGKNFEEKCWSLYNVRGSLVFFIFGHKTDKALHYCISLVKKGEILIFHSYLKSRPTSIACLNSVYVGLLCQKQLFVLCKWNRKREEEKKGARHRSLKPIYSFGKIVQMKNLSNGLCL